MVYVIKSTDGRATVFYTLDYVLSIGKPFVSLDELPEGEGILMTDGVSEVWWEPFPEPEPEPEPIPTDHEILMTLLGVTE